MGQELKADGEGGDAIAFINFHLPFVEADNLLSNG